ncbi:zinc ribbon domain-containing protein [Butyrivibrio sp. VCB2006]|uniref:zinc ribbon domain-containing protein n=1 Tax=Butyrivibrio sp. VCB2006 TaxID=1280679 RepID=UPI000418A579|nr:zinc ribbon domain-containing protein [Butyrivibrio sp. VCB2006]
MICPNCKNVLPDKMSDKVNFCPICGGKLYVDGEEYLIEIFCMGQRNLDGGSIMIFLDETVLYQVNPGEKIYIKVKSGFHSLKFRYKIRNKVIQVLIANNYSIRVSYNSLSGLIETSINEVDETQYDAIFSNIQISKPDMVSENGKRGFDIMLGEDDPEYEIAASSGFRQGILRLYAERLEFSSEKDFKNEIVQYKDVVAIKKKMGSLDIECVGNVHKVYSIPKDIYNEALAFLNNRISVLNDG